MSSFNLEEIFYHYVNKSSDTSNPLIEQKIVEELVIKCKKGESINEGETELLKSWNTCVSRFNEWKETNFIYTGTSTQNIGNDFYQYVNKKWLEDPKNAIPDDYSRWGGFVKLQDTCLISQIELVKELTEKMDMNNDEEKKIAIIWKASFDRFNNWDKNEGNYEHINNELKILNGYFNNNKSYSENVGEYFYYTQINGIDNICDFDKGSDLTASNNVVLDFSMSGLSLPSREYYTDDKFKEKLTLFKNHLKNIEILINKNGQILDTNFVDNIINFETRLASYTMKKEQSRGYDKYFTNTTLNKIYEDINELKSIKEKEDNYAPDNKTFFLDDKQKQEVKLFFEKVYELFNFRHILKENRQKYFDKDDIKAPNEQHITAYDGDAIRRILVFVLNKDNYLSYHSYIQYQIICSLSSFCTKDLDEEFFDFYNRKLNGQNQQKPYDKRSIKIVNSFSGEMLGKIYVSRFFPEKYKKDIRESISEIIKIMHKSIEKNDWLHNDTKRLAIKKLEKFNVKVGYPDVWKDYSDLEINLNDDLYTISRNAKKWSLKINFLDKLNSVVDRNEWLMEPQTVNAYFMPTLNEIVFPAAILQPPFYCKTLNDIDFDISDELKMIKDLSINNLIGSILAEDIISATNFGGIGAVIAHEITHGYDDKGRKFDGDGILNEWWTEKDLELFNSKTQLMIEQATHYSFTDNHVEYKLNGELTMGENLADIGGISLSLQAMTERLKKRNMNKEYIKIIQRILFKSFANIWKQNTKKDHIINQLTTDPHSPSDFRANLVKNMDEFYRAFNIKETDKMYIPKNERVQMW